MRNWASLPLIKKVVVGLSGIFTGIERVCSENPLVGISSHQGGVNGPYIRSIGRFTREFNTVEGGTNES